MNKKEKHQHDLNPLFAAYLQNGQAGPLHEYLLAHSNLPGRRANLELAEVFADSAGAASRVDRGAASRVDRGAASQVDRGAVSRVDRGAAARISGDLAWELCLDMAAIPPEAAPVNDPREFLPFCGAAGLGAIGAVTSARYEAALAELQVLARDPRWRLREAVCFGGQRLLASRGIDTVAALRQWLAGGSWLEMRAAAAIVAEPALLADKKMAVSALLLHREIVAQLLAARDRKSESFRILRQALGYTISVVVAALPGEGRAWLERLQQAPDPDVQWIVRENLKKKRLQNLGQ